MKEWINTVAAVIIAFALLIITFHAIINIQANIAKGYIHSQCELIENRAGERWYECAE